MHWKAFKLIGRIFFCCSFMLLCTTSKTFLTFTLFFMYRSSMEWHNTLLTLKIQQVGSLASKAKRDLLMMDFYEMETITFPPDGSSITPAHHYSEFKFKIYAPIAFRYFRDLFGIQPDDFMVSVKSSAEATTLIRKNMKCSHFLFAWKSEWMSHA